MAEPTYFAGVNRLLQSLPAEVYAQLQPSLEKVSLTFKEILYDVNMPIPYVYFPLMGICSMVTIMQDGTTIEIATVGNEGMIGLPVFLGGDTIPGQAIVQLPGEALRMPSAAFREAFTNFGSLRKQMERYTQTLFVFVSQSAACNRVHTISQRCARWLLLTQDRVETEQFPLTQEFLSQMLGVRRAGVSEVASEFQEAGIIRYNRGTISVLDREGLEARSCECYRIVRDEFERSVGID